MTPLHLEMIIHYNCGPFPFRRETDTIAEYRSQLIDWGLLAPYEENFILTEKGHAWLNHVLDTPMPTQKWVWEDE